MTNAMLIFLGSGLGGISRYGVSLLTYSVLGKQFPYGTLVVNVTGCFLMGLLFELIIERFDGIGVPLRAFLLIGFLGGYTTFSSFSIETINLIENDQWLSGLSNIFFNMTLCLMGTWIGIFGGRYL